MGLWSAIVVFTGHPRLLSDKNEDVQVRRNQIREYRLTLSRPLNNNAISQLNFLISKEKISCGFSKEPSQEDNSFEH